MNNYLIVINPAAGNRDNTTRIKSIEEFFLKSGRDHTIISTTTEKRADIIVQKEFDKKFTHLVVAGGDGTIYEAINGLLNFDKPLGIIPMGTGNDFVKNLNLHYDLNYLFVDVTKSVSVGICNGKKFINGIGTGFDGQIVLNMINHKGFLRGQLAYLYHVIRILGTYRSRLIEYKIDGNSFKEKVFLILAANGTTFGGGFKLAPEADVTDDHLQVTIIKRVGIIRRFRYVNRLKHGKHTGLPEVRIYRAKNIEISSQNIHSQVDGEYAGTPPFSISLLPEKLKILVAVY